MLEEGLHIYKKFLPEDHIKTAEALEGLGEVYLLEGDLRMSEKFLDSALNIVQKNNHPSAYKCLESFATLNLKKSEKVLYQGDVKEAERLKAQAINDLKKALEIIKTRFPEDSPHKARVESKLLNLNTN